MANAVSKMITKMVRDCDQDERQKDGSMHWDTIGPALLRAFAQQGARDFSRGYWEAQKDLSNLQKSKREEQVLEIPESDRKRLQNRIDLSLQEYLEWLSANTAAQCAEGHPQPSSSSSWSPSPAWWSSSSWTQSWQKWHPHRWQDDNWSEQW